MAGRHLRETFDQVAELYDRARPNYPAEVFDDLAALARLPDGARILEIGCGTGQGTLPLARRGYRVICVELGSDLAAADRLPVSTTRTNVAIATNWSMLILTYLAKVSTE